MIRLLPVYCMYGFFMSEPKRITTRQAKRQINTFGLPLIIYIIIFSLLQYASDLIYERFPEIFFGADPEIVILSATSLMTILMVVIFTVQAASVLRLRMSDYLKSPRLSFGKYVALSAIGIGIMMLTTSVSSLFYFFFHTNSHVYTFLGNFNSVLNIIRNVLFFLQFVIIKPICDEYIFRGIIQRQLGHYGRYFGVLASAFLYALAQQNLIDAVPAFFLGWYLSLITLRYHSIKPNFTVHIAVNLFVWLFNAVPGKFLFVLIIALGLCYLISAVSILGHQVSTNIIRYGATEGKLWKILLTSSTIIFVIILFIINVVLSFI